MCQIVDALHDKQSEILLDIWQNEEKSEIRESLNRQYDETVVELLQHLGEDAPASLIDMGQYETFSNLYKSDTNTRPRGFTYAQMAQWMDKRR